MKKIALLACALAAITSSASAALINITMEGPLLGDKVDYIGKNANPTGSNSNNPANHFAWLSTYVVPWYNGAFDPDVPSPAGSTLVFEEGSANGTGPTFDLSNVLFITYHFGGLEPGGIIVALYNDGMTGDFTVPDELYGSGGISTVYAWGTVSVPDSSTTILLLGSALAFLAAARRKIR